MRKMAYFIFLDKVPLPITPSKIQIKAGNQNKTVNLINEGEANILKSPGLTEISFEIMIPMVKYPFAYYTIGFLSGSFFLSHFETLKSNKKPFQFICIRIAPSGMPLFTTNVMVSLEDYSVIEDKNNAPDLMVSIQLKQYRIFGTKTFDYDETTKTAKVNNVRAGNAPIAPDGLAVNPGETIYNLAKKYLGDGGQYNPLLKLNGLTNNLLSGGEKIVFPK